MQIQYYGDYCFKITAKPGGRATEDIILWTDPCDKSSGLRAPVGQAHIVLLSHDSENRERLSGLKGNPVIFDTPGEYAASGFTLQGLPSFRDEESGAVRGHNTLFTFTVEDLNLCFLGALGHPLATEHLSHIEGVDILFIPAGNQDTLDMKHLDELIRKLEPHIVIPMHYKLPGMSLTVQDIKAFCDEVGNCPPVKDTLSKLILKKKDIEGKSMEIVLLEKV